MINDYPVDIYPCFEFRSCLFYFIRIKVVINKNGNYCYLICITYISYFISNISFELVYHASNDCIISLYSHSSINGGWGNVLISFCTVFLIYCPSIQGQ